MKRVLLTGIAGSIGCHVLAHIMHNTDWEIVGLASFHHKGYRDRLEMMFSAHPDWRERVTVIQHDLVCAISSQLKAQIGPIDYILHLAALSDVFYSVDNPAYVILNNVQSTLTMLEYAKTTGHEAFVYFSTDEVYGPVPKGEAHEEWDTHRPSNAYAASKAACEDICYAYWRKGDIKLVITNTMNNFGEMQSASKFPAMIQQKLIRGEKVTIHGSATEIGTRYYIHSRNASDALLFILRTFPPRTHQIGELDEPDRYHIVGERPLSNMTLAKIIADIMGKPLETELVDFHRDNPAHDIHYGLQDNKLRKAGWKIPKSFRDSMAETIKWQQEHPEWLR